MVKFDILSEHSHEDIINHLNVTLLQEKNETLDDACPNMYNTELSYHQNSEPLQAWYSADWILHSPVWILEAGAARWGSASPECSFSLVLDK